MRFNNYRCYARMLFSRGFLRALWNQRRNLAAWAAGQPLPAGPFLAELDVTYRCDLRCRMCARWSDPRRGELTLDEYRRLAAEFADLGVHQISIAGGEPLQRRDAIEIIGAFASRGMSVNLCTNGMKIDGRIEALLASGASCITVSLDGAEAACHDAIRGRPGSHARVVANLEALLAARRGGRRPVIRVRMTVSRANTGEIGRFYRRWRGVADDVLLQPVHLCGDAFYTGADEALFDLDGARIAAELRGTPFAGDRYMGRLVAGLAAGEGFPVVPCYAGVLMARIDPWGNVYPCLEQHVRVGSVREAGGFAAVWRSAACEAERRRLAVGRACRCWYNNTAVIAHYGRLLDRTRWGRGLERGGGRRTDAPRAACGAAAATPRVRGGGFP